MFKSFFVVVLLLAILSITEGAKNIPFGREIKRSKEIKGIKDNNKLYTGQWAVQLKAGQSTDFLKEMGFEVVGKVGSLENVYEVTHSVTHSRFSRGLDSRLSPSSAVSDVLLSHSSVLLAEQQQLNPPHELYAINDPSFVEQWHLVNTGQFDGTAGEDINVQPVWDMGLDGTGILVSIVDDGYQTDHGDLSPRYEADSSRNFVNSASGTPNPYPNITAGNFHGTACAGLVLAASNDLCGVGVAYGARGAGIRLVTGANSFTFVTEATALSYSHEKVDIYSNSWGPVHDVQVAPMGELTKRAIFNNLNTGRNGLGNIYTFAAGNGGDLGDNTNMNGYANSRYVIAVAAVDNNGKWVYYSETGANLLIASPSLGSNSDAGIRTTDILGTPGYSLGNCASDFSGTSAATPIVSGVIALMLQANPKLGWRDVKYILATTATKTDPTNSEWRVNGAGLNVNHQFGFGRVNALAAVNAAKNHTNLPAETSATVTQRFSSISIPDNSATGITQTINFPTTMSAETIEINVVITHPFSGDLRISVTSPQGTESLLAWVHDQIPVLRLGNGVAQLGGASFGPAFPWGTGVSGNIVTAQISATSCSTVTNCAGLSNAIAYVGAYAALGNNRICTLASRTKAFQGCGAVATLFYGDDSDLGDALVQLPGSDPSITIPSAYLDYATASSNTIAGRTGSLSLQKQQATNYNSGWTFTSTRHLGENPAGAWTIKISDGRPSDVGTLSQVTITAYGNSGGTPVSPTTTTTTSSSSSFVSVSFAALFILVACVL